MTTSSSCATTETVTVLAGAAVLGGVGQEVADDLLDVGRVRRDGREPRHDVEGERDARPATLLRFDDARHQALEEHRLEAHLTRPLPETVERDHVLDQPLEPFGLGVDVLEDPALRLVVERRSLAGQELGATEDGRHRRPQLVRQDADERLADRLAATRLGHVAHHHDGLVAARGVPQRVIDRVRRDLDPSVPVAPGGQLDRSAGGPEAGRSAGRVVELGEDVGVRPLIDLREQAMGGRVGETDGAVGRAHDDGLAHGADDGIELRRPGMLGLGEPLQPHLDLDPLADVARDGDDPACAVGQLDRPCDEFDRGRPIAAEPELGQDRLDVPFWRRDRLRRPAQARDGGRPEELVESAAHELVGRAFEQLARPAVDVMDRTGLGIEDEDGLGDRIDDGLGQPGMRQSIGTWPPSGPPDRRCFDLCGRSGLWHGSSGLLGGRPPSAPKAGRTHPVWPGASLRVVRGRT